MRIIHIVGVNIRFGTNRKPKFKRTLLFFSLFIISIFSFAFANAQLPADSLKRGSIKGKIKDSVYNYMLTSSTVAIYLDKDSSLLQYTLPNELGEFALTKLPIAVPLRLIISHVGYREMLKTFTISTDKKNLDMGMLFLNQLVYDSSGNLMEEVVVRSVPPMRMNGDTLEFNAAAYKMSANSTPEDWIRKLPGMVIWGDGEITFNGKKIQRVFVDGKPFMGTGDITVATQNLSMDAVEKLQVYQQRDEKNAFDSTMYANIKLKEDKKMGYFGKGSAGYGKGANSSNKQFQSADNTPRYSIEAMLSGFNKNLQITSVIGSNNVNKVATNVDALLKNSSFKGEGMNLEYQSNFNLRGVNTPKMGGVRLQYDFIPVTQFRKNSRLNTDYFFNSNMTRTINSELEHNYINSDTLISSQLKANSLTRSNDQRANVRYQLEQEESLFNIYAFGGISDDNREHENSSIQEKTGIGTINTVNSFSKSYSYTKEIQTGFSYTRRERTGNVVQSTKRVIPEYTLGYNFSATDNSGNSQNESVYKFPKESERDRKISRFYDKRNGYSYGHNISFFYPRLKELIFGNSKLGGININLKIGYETTTNYNVDEVRDFDPSLQVYKRNNGLSNERSVFKRDFKPGLGVSKYFHKSLTNRYNKNVSLYFNILQQFYNFQSVSSQASQNILYSYDRFIPNASIEYSNHQFGNYEVKYTLNFSTHAEYPLLGQLSPLADSLNPLYLPLGNRNLKPELHRNLEFRYTFTTRTPKNPWNGTLSIKIGNTEDNIRDSILYDNVGGRRIYMINIDGNKYLNSSLSIKKALALDKSNTFEAGIWCNFNISNDPRFIDSKLNISINRYENGAGNISYRFKDILNFKLEQGINRYLVEQISINRSFFNNHNNYTRGIVILQFPKNLYWASNLTYNRSVAGKNNAVDYTIWNSSLTYRFLKGSNGEIKMSALDLLRQNKGITNTANGNIQRFGYTNVLQQYFMLSVAYYPRQFGKKQGVKL